MLRSAASTLAKRTVQRSSRGGLCEAPRMAFHYSARRQEEAKEKSPSDIVQDEGFLGTGISHLYAIPAGIAFAVPALQFDWFLVNEEALLASAIVGFTVVAYSQGGDLIRKALEDESAAMLKLQNDAEDEIIAKMEENLEQMKLTENIVQDYQAVMDLTQQSYDKLNAAGKIKPQHDLKAQVEKMLSMIANEEQNVYEKTKTAMMEEATAAVTKQFATDKALKKAALDSAMAKLTGKKASSDPVKNAFVKFFKDKAAAAKEADDGSEETERRAAMLTKLNGIAETEGMLFRFDESGTPKLVA